ncbi:MAG: hypothetical protein UR52_C0017G0009 [Candidatus Gottesmanbacteria bacterium GW2011_GWA1_34_13]|uniref:Uncharacterized protein n=1 Tax=Candidatus Gottesmanbacteria bacterium GW2011_GWA1_34_13 TaxID=1618434 RepID=A0A0G0ANW9_9BACT|nr:MAG: hypothetical protein UR52_C0017G0009 [Candidatus Gottesmanbacteria bacterium GW2011_GWA1_34_13]
MINVDLLVNFITAFFPWGFAKACIVILNLIYIIFALVVLRQERLMANVVEIPFAPFLRSIAIIHFIASVVALLLVLIIL